MILKYIEYNESVDNVLDIIKENCQPYFEKMKGVDYLFYRGVPEKIEDIKTFQALEKRKPRNTQKYLHDIMNRLSKKKFGWEIRNGVFATHDKSEASRYETTGTAWANRIDGDNMGTTNIFLPIGDFDFVYNEDINDFTDYIYDQRMVPFSDWKDSTGNNKYTKTDWMRDLRLFAQECVDGYTDKINYHMEYNEVSFNVKEYYTKINKIKYDKKIR